MEITITIPDNIGRLPLRCADCGESKPMYPMWSDWNLTGEIGTICLDCEKERRARH